MSVTVILGLRRSGTTIFWEWFRQDPRFTCFDEPYSEQLMRLPREHPKGVFTEYRRLVASSRAEFWATYAPIHRAEELDASLTSRQCAYLQYLAGQGHDVVFDLTRCHLKVRELAGLFPDARFLHLVREECAFASSHLLPSRTSIKGKLRRSVLEHSFWNRVNNFDFWGMESLCGTGPGSKFSLLLEEGGYEVDAFYRLPAVGRLIVLHRYLTRAADEALAEVSWSATVSFEDFSRTPAHTVACVCEAVDIPVPVQTGSVTIRPGSLGYRPSDPRWDELLERVDRVCPVKESS